MSGFKALFTLILFGGIGVVLINGYFVPYFVTGTTTGDSIATIAIPIGFATAIIVAILVSMFGINKKRQG